MIPLHHGESKSRSPLYFLRPRFLLNQVVIFVRTIIKNRATRNVFFFLLLNLSFTFVEITYGIWTNSLGLIGDGIHMLFDSSALIGSLIASVIATWPQNDRFTYGYGRVETMTGFVNTLLLVYASFSIIWEAIERVLDPPEINTDSLLLVSVSGFIVNLIGIFAFEHGGHGHSHGGGDHGHSHSAPKANSHGHSHSHGHNHSHSHGHNHSHGSDDHGHALPRQNSEYLVETEYEDVHKNPLMQGMFLHILADTLGSVGVIISSLMLQYFGWRYADPICSLFMATMILLSVYPLLKSSLLILLQRCPESLENSLPGCYQQVQRVEGVEGFSDPHFWEHNSSNFVGSIKIQAAPTSNEQKIREQVTNIFRKAGVRHFTVEVVKTIQTF